MNHSLRRTSTRALSGLAIAAAAALSVACAPAAPEATTPPSVADGAPSGNETPAGEATPESHAPEEGPGESASIPAEYAGVLAAIPLAEASAGGVAFEVDDGDGGIWEVHVAVGDDEIEVDVDGTGTEVLSSEREGSLDRDDRAGLDAAQITLVEAIELAIGHYGGTAPLDDVDLSEEGGGVFAWEVAFTDDVEIYVDVTDGRIIRVD